MQSTRCIRGLYAITPDEPDTERLRDLVVQALDGGAQLIQYRNKSCTDRVRREQAGVLAALCRERGRTFIVNDDVDIALAVDADGVQVGRDDGSVAQARARLGPHKLLGASCYDRMEAARAAIAAGADHVAFGSFFASSVKPDAAHASIELLRAARAEFSVPIVAIGGITAQNAPALIDAGAAAIAVITALFAAPDVRAAAASLQKLFARGAYEPVR